MKTSDFYYELPQELIAQTPLERRDASRMLVLGREDGSIGHSSFDRLCEYLRPGDCLVMNDSRVIPARLLGRRESGGAVEVLLLRDELPVRLVACIPCAGQAARDPKSARVR